MTLAEWDDVAEALLAYRAHKSLGIGVQIRTARRQAPEVHVRVGEQALELRRVERVAVDDQVAEAAKRIGHGVGEISRDLRHPGAVGRGRDPGDVHAPGLEVDDEEDQVAHQAPDGEHIDAEEACSGDGPPVRFEERVPGHGPSPQGRGLDAVGLEDADA
jgi:hypothetical protein